MVGTGEEVEEPGEGIEGADLDVAAFVGAVGDLPIALTDGLRRGLRQGLMDGLRQGLRRGLRYGLGGGVRDGHGLIRSAVVSLRLTVCERIFALSG